MLPKRIVAIGASTCEGGVDPEGAGFVGRLTHWLTAMDQHNHVYNLGISGETTAQILKRLPVEIMPRKPDLILISGGSNDVIRTGGSDKPTLNSPEVFKKNIVAMLDQASKLTGKVLVVGVNPIDDSKTQPTPWRPENYFLLKDVQQYAQITKEVCQEKGVDYIDVIAEWGNDHANLLHTDGLHPNSRGHEKTFQLIKTYLLGLN
jgi:lysophospholipase L1-like esterase